MTSMIQRPDPDVVLAGLKDFQRRTVDHVFSRMYTDEDTTRRFLIADEVGLGKTLVARGLVARAVEHLWDTVPRIDIVYICSNSDIARQNVNRLNITGNSEFALPSRITLLPTTVTQLDQQKINFISLTPSTSLDLKSSTGTWMERALLYNFLDAAWCKSGVAPLNVLQCGMRRDRFRRRALNFRDWYAIDPGLERNFVHALEESCRCSIVGGTDDLRTQFEQLCDEFRYSRKEQNLPESVRYRRNVFVGALRTLLAKTCISALEPDLIILDEFQRFRQLLAAQSEAGLLAQDLFNYADDCAEARVVLLSATPYKMYTLDEEHEEDHYRDFLSTVDFLLDDPDESVRFGTVLREYRHELMRLHYGHKAQAIQLKSQIEQILRRVMSRTERLSVSADRNGMLVTGNGTEPMIAENDVSDYLELQDAARALGLFDTLEFWKSAPYLLNFMEDYKLKREFESHSILGTGDAQSKELLQNANGLLLNRSDISRYHEIDPRNARLRSLLADTVDAGMWKLLWMPPSLSYYKLEGPFLDASVSSITKRLVFSSWRVVPKVIATLVSYEAERRMIRAFDNDNPENTVEARRRRRPLLRFARNEGRLSNMTTLCILYPSFALARMGDPLEVSFSPKSDSGSLTSSDVLNIVQQRITQKLEEIPVRIRLDGPADDRWYWAAPMLLDLAEERTSALEWFANESLATDWSADSDIDSDIDSDEAPESSGNSAWADHVGAAIAFINGDGTLGPKPEDLEEILARVAIASPAVVALRALSRITGGDDSYQKPRHRIYAGQIAWGFLSLFNLPESMALIRSDIWCEVLPESEPYWKRTLRYCIAGGIQAVLDEYVHLLREALGLLDHSEDEVAARVKEQLRSALTLRTVNLSIDDIRVTDDGAEILVDRYRQRSRFALRYGDSKSDDGKQGVRADQVRSAFNSPFWPFVIATTSVGQEGLDFHMYCHAVVHWNLPSNPVDLEQREGRVHRYKGHAVRKNLAQVYGDAIRYKADMGDPWAAMFAAASAQSTSDLNPFWVFTLEGGAQIERYVPVLPLSRDIYRFQRLRRSLAVYRMVLGQSRQEDMLDYLTQNIPSSEIQAVTDLLRMNLEPPERSSI